MKRKHHNQGFALATLFTVLFILLVLASAIAEIGFQSLRVSAQDENSGHALFAAEAGLAVAAEEVTTTRDLTQPFERELSNGASYEVSYFVNDSSSPLATVRDIEIPPGTAYLHSVGTAANGQTREAGLLLKVGEGVFRVGALGDDFTMTNSVFDSFDSDVGEYPAVSYTHLTLPTTPYV